MFILHQTDITEQLPARLRHGQKVPTAARLLRVAATLRQGCPQDCTVSTRAGHWVQKVYGCVHHADCRWTGDSAQPAFATLFAMKVSRVRPSKPPSASRSLRFRRTLPFASALLGCAAARLDWACTATGDPGGPAPAAARLHLGGLPPVPQALAVQGAESSHACQHLNA